jgi:RimJ/RimL family protein N-acetyltransferase
MFASTERLNLRPLIESDAERYVALKNDLRVRPTVELDYMVPIPETTNSFKAAMAQMSSSFVYLNAELKSSEGQHPQDDKEDYDARFVGFVALFFIGTQKNRDVNVGIGLKPEHWGKGYGSEMMRWIIDYAFEQLGMHRVTLDVLDGNERALRLYKQLYVSSYRNIVGTYVHLQWLR